MSPRSFALTEEMQAYVTGHSTAPSDVEASCIAQTDALGGVSRMQISPEQGVLLRNLVHMVQPRLVVEVGTFTGYSSLMMAQALPEGGRMLCCDVSEEWTALARTFWVAAGVEDRIDLRIAPASETLAGLPSDTVVDFAFVDADKGGYRGYVEALLPLLSDRGAIAIDNTLWSGQVLNPDDTSTDTVALVAFNNWLVEHPGLDVAVIPIGDGLTLIRRR